MQYSCSRTSGFVHLSVGKLSALRSYIIGLFAKVSAAIFSDDGHLCPTHRTCGAEFLPLQPGKGRLGLLPAAPCAWRGGSFPHRLIVCRLPEVSTRTLGESRKHKEACGSPASRRDLKRRGPLDRVVFSPVAPLRWSCWDPHRAHSHMLWGHCFLTGLTRCTVLSGTQQCCPISYCPISNGASGQPGLTGLNSSCQ